MGRAVWRLPVRQNGEVTVATIELPASSIDRADTARLPPIEMGFPLGAGAEVAS